MNKRTQATVTLLTLPIIGLEQAAHSPFGCTMTPCSARLRSSASNNSDRSPALCFDTGDDTSGSDTSLLSLLTYVTGRLLVGKRYVSSDDWYGTLTRSNTTNRRSLKYKNKMNFLTVILHKGRINKRAKTVKTILVINYQGPQFYVACGILSQAAEFVVLHTLQFCHANKPSGKI